jgi:flagellar assembly factor FliW
MTLAPNERTALHTTCLGQIEWEQSSELFLPAGLPGFEGETRIVPVEIPAYRPLVFLQSAQRPDLCFAALPAKTITSGFRLCLTEEEKAALELPENSDPDITDDVLCLALLQPAGSSVQVNLDAPVVVNLHNCRCIQSLGRERMNGYYRLTADSIWRPLC